MKSVKIIAEIGVNHNGKIDLAKDMIQEAANCGADYVKFQTFRAKCLAIESAPKADYQSTKSGKNESQYEMLKKLELNTQDHHDLIEYSNSRGVKFVSSAFDLDSLDFINKLNLPFFKVPSGEITNYLYLKKLAKFNKPVILSTGMSNIEEVEESIKVLTDNGFNKNLLTLLHCNTDYPTSFKDVNLYAMKEIEEKFKVQVGYSDHTQGIEVAIAAVSLGAKVIEKHFTLNKALEGPDHKASSEPKEFTRMVKAIRNIEKAISGSGKKTPSISETKNINLVRKSIYLAKNIKKMQTLKDYHLICLRPGGGISPMKITEIIGRKTKKFLKKGDKLKWENLL